MARTVCFADGRNTKYNIVICKIAIEYKIDMQCILVFIELLRSISLLYWLCNVVKLLNILS